MGYEVVVEHVEEQRTLVVRATTTWEELARLWRPLLDEVWACLEAGRAVTGHRNVMLFRNDIPSVEIGVVLDEPPPLVSRVEASSLPAGTVARTLHRGPFDGVGAAHDAILAWCRAHRCETTRTRWEIYGPHDDDPEAQWVEVAWLLHPLEAAGRDPGSAGVESPLTDSNR